MLPAFQEVMSNIFKEHSICRTWITWIRWTAWGAGGRLNRIAIWRVRTNGLHQMSHWIARLFSPGEIELFQVLVARREWPACLARSGFRGLWVFQVPQGRPDSPDPQEIADIQVGQFPSGN